MSVRARSILVVVCAAAVALTVAGCGGGGDDENKDAAEPGAAPPTTLAPLPKVAPAQVKPLVGRWVGTGKDVFRFKTDGSGVWQKGGQTLWSGKAIPEGKGKYRFSWQGGDPKEASYWGVTLTDGGTKLLFAGTNQSYTKAKG